MKRFIYGLVGVVCMCSMTLSVYAQTFNNTIQNRRYVEQEAQQKTVKTQKKQVACGHDVPIRVASFVTNPPFGWVDVVPGQGSYPDQYFNDGFAFVLFHSIANKLGLTIKNVGYTSYYEALKDLKNGDVDVLLGSYYDKRTLGAGTSILFPSYVKNPIIVVFKLGQERDVKSLDDLKGLKGGIRQEELLYSLLYDSIPEGVQMEQIAGSREAYSQLMLGKIDYLVTSLYAAEAEVRRFKITDKVSLTRVPLMEPELFYVFSSVSECRALKPQIEAQLRQEKENSGYISNLLFDQVDKWADRFRYEEPLIDTLSKTVAPKMPEKASDIRIMPSPVQ